MNGPTKAGATVLAWRNSAAGSRRWVRPDGDGTILRAGQRFGSCEGAAPLPVRTCNVAVHGPLLFSVAEVAALLRIHRATVYDLLATGELRSTMPGRRRSIPRAALEELVAVLDRRAGRDAAESRAAVQRAGGVDGAARDGSDRCTGSWGC